MTDDSWSFQAKDVGASIKSVNKPLVSHRSCRMRPCWCADWSHPFQKNETSMIYYESFLSKQAKQAFWEKLWALSFSTKNLVQTKTSIQDPAVSQNHRVDSYPMYLYRFQGSNHSIALATFLLRPARGARGSAKGVPEANLPKDHMKPKWTHVSTIN